MHKIGSMHDNKRVRINLAMKVINPNLSAAEDMLVDLTIVSNGFKIRESLVLERSGHTYIYMAFAEEPLIGDNPATAR